LSDKKSGAFSHGQVYHDPIDNLALLRIVMPYERNITIESRLQEVLRLVSEGHFSANEIARLLGVSVPTVSRDVSALRQRGYSLKAERHGMAWRYKLIGYAGSTKRMPVIGSLVTA
jgi:biotin operon repressor